ncbi:MAG: hypothetical protein EA359_07125, partial [Balneolaceae bacterium]
MMERLACALVELWNCGTTGFVTPAISDRFVENCVFSPERAKSQSPGQSEHSECKRTSPRESRGNQCPPSDGLIKAPDRIEGVIDRLRLEEKSAVVSHETARSFPVIFNMV